jgi:3-oxoacyl-[acyl-carrier-protein] synthase II
MGCQGYNNVIVNGNKSFEYALLDSLMLLKEGGNNILVGGLDEIANRDLELKRKARYCKPEGTTNLEMLSHSSPGTIPGEGSTFFLLSTDKQNCKSYINSVSVFHSSLSEKELSSNITSFLAKQDLDLDDIDIVLSGKNGDVQNNEVYDQFERSCLNNHNILYYKQLCGEYDTSSAYALWLSDKIISTQEIPTFTSGGKTENTKSVKHILIYNHCGEEKHAVILVSKAEV